MSFQILTMKPWATPQKNNDLDLLITGGFILLTLFMFLYVGSAGGEIQDVFRNFTNVIYIFALLCIGLVIQMANRGKERIYGGFGESKDAYKGSIFGVALGVILIMGTAMKMATPLGLGVDAYLAMLYLVTVVPFAEEKVFGQSLPFILSSKVKNPWIVIFVSCLIFAIFHFFVSNAIGIIFIFTFLLRAVILLGNEKFKTSAFGIVLHYTNNFLLTVFGK